MNEEMRIKYKKWIDECLSKLNMDLANLKIINTNYGIKATLENDEILYSIGVFEKPKIPTLGIGSLVIEPTQDKKFMHVLFLDYDWINEWIVEQELEWLAKEYNLSNFYLFYTRRYYDEKGSEYDRYYGNYMAISLSLLPFNKIIEIIKETHCDDNYKRVPSYMRYKMWVLRMIGKGNVEPPTFLKIIPNEPVNMNNLISKRHRLFLEKLFNVPSLPYTNEDNSKFIFLTPYLTSKG